MPDRSEAHFVGLLGGVLLSVLVLFAGAFLGALQPPPPAPIEAGKNEQEPSASEESQASETNDAPQQNAPTALESDGQPKDGPERSKSEAEKRGAPNDSGVDGLFYRVRTHWGWKFADGVITLLATLVIAFYAWRQWATANAQTTALNEQSEYMRDQLKFSTEQMQLEHRAWLSIDSLTPFAGSDGDVYGCLRVNNSGKTPGMIRRIRINAFDQRPSIDTVPPRLAEIAEAMETEVAGENPIAPNSTPPLMVPVVDLKESQLPREGDRYDTKSRFLLVRFEYEDIFKRTHVTTGCFMLDRANGQTVAIEYKYGNQIA